MKRHRQSAGDWALTTLPHQPADDNPVPAPGADVGERPSCSTERSEGRRISRVKGRVRRIEAMVLVHIVHIKTQLEPHALADDWKFLGQRRLHPDQAWRL